MGRHRPGRRTMVVMLALALAGCQQAVSSFTPVPSATPRPPTPLATATPSPLPSVLPTQLPETLPPSPTPTQKPTPSATQSPLATVAPSGTPAPTAWSKPLKLADGSFFSLAYAIDGSGVSHIAAQEPGDGTYYLTNASGTWTSTKVTDAPPDGADVEAVIALDGSTVYIFYAHYTQWSECFDCELPVTLDGYYYVTNASGMWSAPIKRTDPGADNPLDDAAVRDGVMYLTYDVYPNNDDPNAYSSLWYATNKDGADIGVRQYGSHCLLEALFEKFMGKHCAGSWLFGRRRLAPSYVTM